MSLRAHCTTVAVAGAVALVTASAPWAATIRVPLNAPTIQAGIDAAASGDTVLVAPGTYVERIRIIDKTVTVKSESGPDATVISGDGARGTSQVTMRGTGGAIPTLSGFRITNGFANGSVGQGIGGISIYGAGVIRDNQVVGNRACGAGGGIGAEFSSAVISHNVISGNSQDTCTGGPGGGGVYIGGNGSVQLLDNVIENNTFGTSGGGVSLFAAGTPTIAGNVIRNNGVQNSGGGISISNASNAVIQNNLIVGNSAAQGAGIAFVVPTGEPGPMIVNNTIAGNLGVTGTGIFVEGSDTTRSRISNNILVGGGSYVLSCQLLWGGLPPIVEFNDIWATDGATAASAGCNAFGSGKGNLALEPGFAAAAAGDYHLALTSPLIDAGTTAAWMPVSDIDGTTRPLDGNGDGIARADIGAYEAPGSADSTPPQLVLPAIVNADATSPTGAVVTYAATATDGGDPAPRITCAPPSGAAFAIGATTVTCTATDSSGNSASGSFTVRVHGAAEQIDALRSEVAGVSDKKLRDSLDAKLRDALKNLSNGKVAGACTNLNDFAKSVADQRGKKIATQTANEWIADATRIRGAVGC